MAGMYGSAQSIKGQLQQKEQQQKYEREQRENKLKQQARIQKAQLNLNDLLQLLQSKDLEYVDKFLSERGWKLHSTDVKEKNDNRYNYDIDDEERIVANYKTVTWSFGKDLSNDNLATSWFYFYLYPTYDNAILYAIANDKQLDRLKSELTNNGYKRIYPTDAIARGLESVYRDSLYQVNFKKQLKEQYDEGADIHYSFFIYNYKQLEERKAEAERLAREKIEKEEKYRNAVQRAETAYSQKQYVIAKQSYNEALAIKSENQDMFSDKFAEIDINILCEEGEHFFKIYQYDSAKAKYADALLVKPNKKYDYINEKIQEISDFQIFLKERTYKQYDYKALEISDYKAKDDYIVNELWNALLVKGQTVPKTDVSIICEVDTLGVSKISFNTSVQSDNLDAVLKKSSENLRLKQVFVNGYAALAKAEFNYTIEFDHAVITVKKNSYNISSNHENFNAYRSDINSKLGYDAPNGKYTFDMNKTTINGQVYDNNKLVKMNSSVGPSNAFLSLLVPGLGDHRVTNGRKKGIGIAVSTYALITSGIVLKFYSNSEYKKYHAATEQIAMDEHYKRANYSNQAFYACMVAGGIIWISDIIWVWSRGAKNAKAAKAYKQSLLGVYYQPDFNATGLTYTVNF
jgi:hypothetical protein